MPDGGGGGMGSAMSVAIFQPVGVRTQFTIIRNGFGMGRLAGIGDRDLERRISFRHIGREADVFHSRVVGCHHEGTFIEIVKVLHHDICAPEPGPIAFCRRRGLGDEEHVRGLPDHFADGCQIVPVLGSDQLAVEQVDTFQCCLVERLRICSGRARLSGCNAGH